MLNVFTIIRNDFFWLSVIWLGLYAFGLIDDLRNNYTRRSSTQVGWMLLLDFTGCLLVVVIWIAANVDPERKEGR